MNEPLHKKNFQPDASCPLDGIRILDLSRLVSGNMISLQLADFGAEVIKIENPKKGDPLRHWDVEGHGTAWKVYGRNKKSISLNIRAPEGAKILLELAKESDVLIENFRPGTLEKTPFSPDKLRVLNPNLILVRVSGWGQTGPYRERLGFGSLVEGASGFAASNGFSDREPVLPPLALADMVAGLSGAMSVLVALRHRDQNGGGGQEIDLSLLEPIFSILGPQALNYKITGEVPERTGSSSNTAAPRGVYESKDGKWISMSASMQVMAERVLTAMGRKDLISDPRFLTNGLRVKNNKDLDPLVRQWIGERTLKENMEIFKRESITAAPVLDISQIVEDEHFREREVLIELPDDELGAIPMHNIHPRLSKSPGQLRRPAPRLGQHNGEILGELGLNSNELARLYKNGII
jgi:crotonobetainyl-CoA:carnitine CoA-transferase CaiB-like acyl-CoA transferase